MRRATPGRGLIVFLAVSTLLAAALTAGRALRGSLDVVLVAHTLLLAAWTSVAAREGASPSDAAACRDCGRPVLGVFHTRFCPGCGTWRTPA